MTTVPRERFSLAPTPLRFLRLELTGRYRLTYTHCYADSGPTGTYGTMSTEDWARVIDQAAELGAKLV